MKTIKVTISGPALLMHNGRLANPLDPYTKALKAATVEAKRQKKTDESLIEVARTEFQGGLYHDDDIGPYLPREAIEAMIVEGSRKAKQGKEFVSVSVEEDRVPLQYKGPREREALWGDERFRYATGVKVGRARVMRMRPVFKDWRASFTIAVEDDATVTVADVEKAIVLAGRKIGLGDWRPGAPHGGRHGRFAVESFEEVAA